MIYKVKDVGDFIKFAKELKAVDAIGIILKEELFDDKGELVNVKLCLQTNITDVIFESPAEDSGSEETIKVSMALVEKIESFYRVCNVQTLNINTTADVSDVLF